MSSGNMMKKMIKIAVALFLILNCLTIEAFAEKVKEDFTFSEMIVETNESSFTVSFAVENLLGYERANIRIWPNDLEEDSAKEIKDVLIDNEICYTIQYDEIFKIGKMYKSELTFITESGEKKVYLLEDLLLNDNKTLDSEVNKNDISFDYSGNSINEEAIKQNDVIKSLNVENSDGKYKITVQISMGIIVDRVEFPSWTLAKGQDDLTWEKGTISGNTATYVVDMKDHNYEIGDYCTDIYVYGKSGILTKASTGIQVMKNDAPKISEIKTVQNGGKLVTTAKVNDAYGIDRVEFPTWTLANGQDDLTWEKGTINGDIVTYTVDMKDHNYEIGNYCTDIYVYDRAGVLTKASTGIQVMKNDAPKISDIKAVQNGGKLIISAKVHDDYGLDRVEFPTWTLANGQDDLTWERGVINGDMVTYTIDIKNHNFETGSYYTDIYVYDKAGIVTKATTGIQVIKNDAPKVNSIKVEQTEGKLNITVNASSIYGLDRVEFPTWTLANGQDDLTWESGSINGDSVVYTVDIKNHNYETGYYYTDIYVYDKAGFMTKATTGVQTIKNESKLITDLKLTKTDGRYQINLKLNESYNIERVEFPTWTLANGQDDLTWERGKITGNTVSYTIEASSHNYETGAYATHIYVYEKSGRVTVYPIYTNISIAPPEIYNTRITNDNGKYIIKADVSGYGLSHVEFPTWSTKNGQDDLTWEKGTLNENTITYTIEASKHKNDIGEYLTDIYLYDRSGNLTTQYVKGNMNINAPIISDVKATQYEGKYVVTATVSGYNIQSVQFPTWTIYNGQDDLTWEKGTLEGNKITYTVDMKDHNYEGGDYITHIYVYDTLGNVTTAYVSSIILNDPPTISNIKVSDINEEGFLVTCEVNDGYGIDKVEFSAWTIANGQDDFKTSKGVIKGNTVSYRVLISDHKSESGSYQTVIYAYDKAGLYTVATVPKVEVNTPGWKIINSKKNLYDAKGKLVGSGKLIIDISEHNKNIDWIAVKNSGVDGVILRSSFGCADDFSQMDKYFKKNVEELNRIGLPYGIYHFSYATDLNLGAEEAKYVLKCMREAGARPTLPIYYDLEYSSYVGDKNASFYANLTTRFANVIQSAGYKVGVYANANWWSTKLTADSFDFYDKWIANYGTFSNNEAGTASSGWRPSSEYKIWQYTSCGQVNGINSNVDMNILYD